MKRFCLVLVLPLLLASACETAGPNPAWAADDVDRARLGRLAADPWLRPEQSSPGGSAGGRIPGGDLSLLSRPSTTRWSEEPIPGSSDDTDAPDDALSAEIGSAERAGWFVTGAHCFSGYRVVVGFAKPAGDLDHAEAAYLYQELREEYDPSGERVQKKKIVVVGVAPHHADRGWPKYVPVQLTDTCLADPHRPRVSTDEGEAPKPNPPPPETRGYRGPLDQAGKPFLSWDDLNRFVDEIPRAPASSTPATSST